LDVLRVRVADETDAAEAGHILAEGFGDDPTLSWVFRDPDRRTKLNTFFDYLVREALIPLGATYLVQASCAAWTPPDPPSWSAERSERFSTLLRAVCSGLDLERLAVLEAAMQAHQPDGQFWYLSSIATVPAARGQGLGTELLQASLQIVDQAHLPAYLESTNRRNVSLYQRHGFMVTGSIELPDGPTLTRMWRNTVES
jgi:ribosomal protein S18 acetylase RimI-like enzyme